MTTLRTAKRFVFPLLGIWVLLYGSFSLFKPPLLDGSDALSAEIAREMLTGGHWLTPFANGIVYPHHPPLLYWTVAVSFGIFNVSDWAARLPVAIAILGLCIATFSLGRRIFHSPAAAFYAVLTLLTSYGVFLFGHLLIRDVFLCLWTTLALNFFWRSLTQQKRLLESALGFATCCALGVLTQGLSGLLLPLIIAVLYLAFTHNLGHLRRWHPIPAILTFLVLYLPWHFAARHALRQQDLMNLLPRFTGGRVPLIVFWPLLLLWIIPWCAYSLRALRIGASPEPDRRRQARCFSLIWILTVLLFFSFTARQEFNLLTALPPMALLAGGWLAEDEAQLHHEGRIAAWILFFFGLAASALIAYYLIVAPVPAPGVDIATLIRSHPGHHAVFFAYFLDLTRNTMGAVRGPLWITLIATLVGVSVSLFYRLRDNARMANCFLAGMIVAILIAAHLALNTFSPVLSSEILAEAIHPEVQPADLVVVNGHIDDASSFVFYLERNVLLLNHVAPNESVPASCSGNVPVTTKTTVLSYVGPPPQPFFINHRGLCGIWQSPARVWLWTPLEDVPTLPGNVYVIGRSGGKEVLSNQPNTGGASF
ncbi:MAG TPA: glycosyltransferase family 39 protein [Acidobacteriaceae bacterium]|nr:glycosyltransferase family 39 protein [Acidobacteriaceae bacterium]